MTPAHALTCIRDAFRQGRYYIEPRHAVARMKLRRVTKDDIKHLVANAQFVEAYRDRTPAKGTTCWRVVGCDLDGVALEIGIDLTIDHLGNHALVTTVM